MHVDHKAVNAAWTEFNRAFQSITELGTSNHYAEVERHWATFLVSAGRVFTKLEQGAKSSGKSGAWWGRKVNERRTEPILRYIWHARNADEHGIQPVTELHPGSIKEVTPTPEETENFHRTMGQQAKPYAALALLEIVNPHVKLVEITDRGVIYKPPATFFGETINGPNPHNVGLLALSYLEKILKEADKLAI